MGGLSLDLGLCIVYHTLNTGNHSNNLIGEDPQLGRAVKWISLFFPSMSASDSTDEFTGTHVCYWSVLPSLLRASGPWQAIINTSLTTADFYRSLWQRHRLQRRAGQMNEAARLHPLWALWLLFIENLRKRQEITKENTVYIPYQQYSQTTWYSKQCCDIFFICLIDCFHCNYCFDVLFLYGNNTTKKNRLR